MKKNWYTSKITLWILLGLLLGIGVGFIGMSKPEAFATIQPALDLFYSLYISAGFLLHRNGHPGYRFCQQDR